MPVDPTTVEKIDLAHAPDAVKAAVAALSAAINTTFTARRELGVAHEAMRLAPDADVRDTAVAMAAGKPDPGRKHADAAAVALAAAERRYAASEQLADGAMGALSMAVTQHRAEWFAAAKGALASELDVARKSLTACLTALGTATRTGSTCAWLAGPEYALPHRAGKWRMADLPGNVAGDLAQLLADLDARAGQLETISEPEPEPVPT